jgi:hypothetical protein
VHCNEAAESGWFERLESLFYRIVGHHAKFASDESSAETEVQVCGNTVRDSYSLSNNVNH